MNQETELRWHAAIREILGAAHTWRSDDLAPSVGAAASRLGLRTRIWVVDYEQTGLRALSEPDRTSPDPLPIDGSLAGRAFARVTTLPAGGDDSARRWWVPMVDGTDRQGVMEFVASDDVDTRDPVFAQRCEQLAGLVGHLIATTSARADHLEAARRSQPMSIAAELLWQLLPPLTSSGDRVVVSAILQPCYQVGGDGFDYALEGQVTHVVILDAVGRGLRAGLGCAVALAAVRATRRAGGGLYEQARAADAALIEQFPDVRFATAVLAELDTDTGRLRYLNAGHPRPLVLRAGRPVRELPGGKRMPLGLDDPAVQIGEEMLEPDDLLLLYTDGVTEARMADGDRFGLSRLVNLVERHAGSGLPAPETLRRLAHAVLEHQEGELADDATVMVVHWSSAAAMNTVPKAAQPDGPDGSSA